MFPVPAHVAEAFGADATRLRRLPGGQQRTWTDDEIVLKPADNPVEHSWVCDVFTTWPDEDEVEVGVPEPVASADGAWVYAGWAAHRYVPGRSARMTWEPDVIRAAGEAFHRLTSRLERPAFLEHRTDAWAYGDRVAWEDADPIAEPDTLEQITRLRAACHDVATPPQVIHGDLGGNVLVRDDGRPVVIDWPPYYRPAGFALAVAAADAVRWEDVAVDFLDDWADVPDWWQLLARALVYRLATFGVQQRNGLSVLATTDHAAASEPAVQFVLSRINGG
jgi:uncharacterized protein (TIGR02569 family)